MVRRIYVEKKEGFDTEARYLEADLQDFIGNDLAGIRLRIIRRYDTEAPGQAILDEKQFEMLTRAVFSDPLCENVFFEASFPAAKDGKYFGVELRAGQYDQAADFAEQNAELALGFRPRIKTAYFYVFENSGKAISNEALEKIKKYIINPVSSREAGPELPETLEEGGRAGDVPVLDGFISDQGAIPEKYGLAMSAEDLEFCRSYFAKEGRDPSLTELRLLDTYWSDHCRHSTFNTYLEEISLEGPENKGLEKALELYKEIRQYVYGKKAKSRPMSLMDMATIGAKYLKKKGLIDDVDESAEVNACTVKIEAEFSKAGIVQKEPWFLLFKNETHNHPTEIEPFGGAATCLGGGIRDPLSGRAHVHQAMRITGGGDPKARDTMPGKLPQLKLAREAAAGYSSYGNQVGIAAGQVTEFYHPGFLAKRLELGALIGAVPQAWVRREEPESGDLVILVGGRTGRDGIGGATGSSKVQTGEVVEQLGAEVPAAEVPGGNAVEERKLLRLFRKAHVCRFIKRCNDFGAGGVSVAVGELAAGLDIDLDSVPQKYPGLDGTDLAISESQERMAVVVDSHDAEAFIREAAAENLEATIIARVTASPRDEGARLRMNWQGKSIVDISREFLNSSGVKRSVKSVSLPGNSGTAVSAKEEGLPAGVLMDQLERELRSLRSGSRRGLQECFDGSIGSSSALFPWGGSEQGTPECGMAALLPSLEMRSLTASLMCFGYDPVLMSKDPYRGAKASVREALAKFACLGGDYRKARLSFQEYFERPQTEESWGRPAAALLGALEAQLRLEIPAIGGKDSMSGNYKAGDLEITVPPTLVAFAAGTAPVSKVRSGALSGKSGNIILLLYQAQRDDMDKIDEWECFKANMKSLEELSTANMVRSAYPVGVGGVAASLALMAFGNMCGVEAYGPSLPLVNEHNYQGSILVEIEGEVAEDQNSWIIVARSLDKAIFRIVQETENADSDVEDISIAEIPLAELRRAYEYPLSRIYPQTSTGATVAEPADCDKSEGGISPPPFRQSVPASPKKAKSSFSLKARPLVILPVFPGTNGEWDMEQAFREAAEIPPDTRLVVFRNRSREDIEDSLKELEAALGQAQIIAFSGGGEGKFIASVLRSPAINAALMDFYEQRDGLILGIGGGFDALLRTGLIPYGRFQNSRVTMAHNSLGRHVSRMVKTRVMPASSPWLSLEEPGALHTIPISHGEGRIVINREEAEALFSSGQVPFCYADAQGEIARSEPENPFGSAFGIESLCSPDGRILGKMGHSERAGEWVHINIPGNKRQRIFEAGIQYFT